MSNIRSSLDLNKNILADEEEEEEEAEEEEEEEEEEEDAMDLTGGKQ